MAHDTPWKRLGSGELMTEDADEGLGHIVPFKVYLKTLLTLIVLTILTVYTAKFVDLGKTGNTVLALFIATGKAAIVMMFFMHVKFEGKLLVSFVLYPFLILFLLIGGTLGDVTTRGDIKIAPPGVEYTEELPRGDIKKDHH